MSADGQRSTVAGGPLVRPQAADHAAGGGVVVAEDPPVPVQQLLDVPRFPRVATLVAVAAAVLVVLTAFSDGDRLRLTVGRCRRAPLLSSPATR